MCFIFLQPQFLICEVGRVGLGLWAPTASKIRLAQKFVSFPRSCYRDNRPTWYNRTQLVQGNSSAARVNSRFFLTAQPGPDPWAFLRLLTHRLPASFFFLRSKLPQLSPDPPCLLQHRLCLLFSVPPRHGFYVCSLPPNCIWHLKLYFSNIYSKESFTFSPRL